MTTSAPVFETLFKSADLLALLGPTVMRLYEFGNKPVVPTYPYATYQNYAGDAQQFLGNLPDVDSYSIQFDIYSKDASSLRSIALAMRDAIEPHAYITRWGMQGIDDDSKCYRYSFDVDWMVLR
ncbi:DUF3168 domain-containing protein [Pantoea sp. Al-1710]|uniref:DUF3168 domain-containing protein n=1 Tax=Candidatus Pantoea communis TaxID=2608354 RepID=A0ABX0RI50_9GAMM|nr:MULTISPECIES: DUF3168 domain-containing protein [Pantoea]NIG13018.1 DUF3168 domain-containing protein [Pantoea sp. Cy-640]NIG17281.1 DUF3168 domain-containing protein [Pantoea communis]